MSRKNPSQISPTEQRYLEAVADVRGQPVPKKNQIAFIPKEFVQVNLPHSDPGEIPIWKRTNGKLTLSMRSGWDHVRNQPLGYPYGTIPRLLIFWLTGEVLRTKNRRIFLGQTLTEFLKELGLDSQNGGDRSDTARLKEQMERLFRATISFDFNSPKTDSSKVKRWIDMQIATDGELWWHPKEEQGLDWQSWIELSEKFYESILMSPVPVDARVLKAFRNTALGLDIYSWLAYKLYQIRTQNEPCSITWSSFSEQIGSDYSDLKNFTRKAKDSLEKIRILYPQLRIEYLSGGFSIYPGILFVPEKDRSVPFLIKPEL